MVYVYVWFVCMVGELMVWLEGQLLGEAMALVMNMHGTLRQGCWYLLWVMMCS